MRGFVNGYVAFALWITKLAYVNLLWVAFTVCGLVIFGILPATAGMFAVTRKWIMGEQDIPIAKTFLATYRKEFFKVNAVGLSLFLVIYLLTIQFQVLRSMDGINYFIASYVVLALFFIISIALLYLFPIYVHFNLTVFDHLKWSFVIGIIHPILTVFLMVVVVVLNYATFIYIPGLLFFFGGSVTAYILMWGVSKTFSKYEEGVATV
ncbi:YesL family protein [Sporosarcina sp. 6E9]|uniref:YesL family protein n=1 Tax=Sporosarcina sp. 6E9 TaxID=2819235 RepID=UPI001B316A1C|nr:YesL family protein [Sporosarcina sp. 6E9]